MKPKIILLCGATGTGKSTVALELAHKLEIKQIVDIDIIREVLRGERDEKYEPYLFTSSYKAWKIKGDNSDSGVIDSFLKYCKSVESSVKKVIDRVYVLGKDTIIEGVHLVPSSFKEYTNREEIYPFMINYEDPSKHLSNFYARKCEFNGKDVDRFIENFDKIMLIQDYLVKDAQSNGWEQVVNDNLDLVIQKVIGNIQ
ncbi:MAG: hypothetical protein KKA79_09420 [Nanoarchaeota archaeon]|nr:hypothetical protein [Nanoarchaeota archaeon]MCG2717558.1 hypothetical protein [Nanoarchaeota archaeon]